MSFKVFIVLVSNLAPCNAYAMLLEKKLTRHKTSLFVQDGLILRLNLRSQRHIIILSLRQSTEIRRCVSQNAHLSFPLSKDSCWFRRTPLNLRIDILCGLGMTARVIDALSNLLGIHPHELLRLIKPLHLEFFLANRTETVCESGIIWHCKILKLRHSRGGTRDICNCSSNARLVLYLTGFDPVLKNGERERKDI
jgi:hypothetical protein